MGAVMGVVGFDFQGIARRALVQPFNEAVQYGVQVQPFVGAEMGWRCIGVYHLRPEENTRRHNVYIDAYDGYGGRTLAPLAPIVRWRTWHTNPIQTRMLDKPATEPGADIPLDWGASVQLWCEWSGYPSDLVSGLHTAHDDEGSGNTRGHHSFYVVFQLRGGQVQPPPDKPKTLEERVADLERRVTTLERG